MRKLKAPTLSAALALNMALKEGGRHLRVDRASAPASGASGAAGAGAAQYDPRRTVFLGNVARAAAAVGIHISPATFHFTSAPCRSGHGRALPSGTAAPAAAVVCACDLSDASFVVPYPAHG